jgi:hypothetical protein
MLTVLDPDPQHCRLHILYVINPNPHGYSVMEPKENQKCLVKYFRKIFV